MAVSWREGPMRRPWVLSVVAVIALAVVTVGTAALHQGAGEPLPPDVPIEVTLHLGGDPGKLEKITSTGMVRALFPGMSVGQRVTVRNVASGYGAARVEMGGNPRAVGGGLETGPMTPATVDPGRETDLVWTESVPAGAEVGPFQNDVSLTRDGVVFARLRLKQGAGEPVKLRSLSYVNPAGNDVNAYILFPGGTARIRFTIENIGDAPLTVSAVLSHQDGLTCSVSPASATLARGGSHQFVVTCQGAATLTDANDQVIVRFRRG